jgi:hypothetical protein
VMHERADFGPGPLLEALHQLGKESLG